MENRLAVCEADPRSGRDQMDQKQQDAFRQPFKVGSAITPEHRQVLALEYIAAQLGMIREAMEAQNVKRARE